MLTKSEIETKLKNLERKLCCVSSSTSVFSQEIIDSLNAANVPDGLNPFATLADIIDITWLTEDTKLALISANLATALNPYATLADLASIAPGTTITIVPNYSALPDPTTVSGEFYWTETAQGTYWLPGALGGTYFPVGLYYSNGVIWTYMPTPFQATQPEVDAGINNDKFVTSLTLKNSSQWGTKADSVHTHTASDITDFDTEVSNNTNVVANTAKVSNATHTGDVTGSTVLTLANTAVTPGTYAAATITVDSKGRLTNAVASGLVGVTTGFKGDINITDVNDEWFIANGVITAPKIEDGTITGIKLANDAVTYAKMQNVSAASRLLGRGSASGAGDTEEITLGSGLTMTGTTLSASGGGGTTYTRVANVNIPTPTVFVTIHSFAVTAGKSYAIKVVGAMTANSTTASQRWGNYTGPTGTLFYGHWVTQTSSTTSPSVWLNGISPNTTMVPGSAATSTATLRIELDGLFTVTTNGTIAIQATFAAVDGSANNWIITVTEI